MFQQKLRVWTPEIQQAHNEQRMAGGGLLKAAAKAVKAAKPTLKAVQKVLPAAERDANLAKMLEGSAVQSQLYHGTGRDIKEFDKSKLRRTAFGDGFHLAESPNLANFYANQFDEGQNVMPVHAAIKKPYELKNMHDWYDIPGNNDKEKTNFLKSQGYDGIKYPHGAGGDPTSPSPNVYVAFEPEQIKSATGNRGTFDTTKPDLNEAHGGAVHMAGGGDPRKRAMYPKMPTQAIIESPGFDPEVPSDLSRAYARRMADKAEYERSMADQKLTPTQRGVAGLEAAGMLGSAMFEGVQQLPKLLDGKEAYEQAVGKGMYQPRFQPEKAAEYVGNVGDFLEQLETKYKMPQILPETLGFAPLAEAAKRQAGKAVKQGAMTAASRMEAGPKAGSMAAQRGAVKLGDTTNKAEEKTVQLGLKIKPPSDNILNVRQANFQYPKSIGNQTIKIDELSGGVRLNDPTEAKRVKQLADKIASPDGYISRIIVDQNNNVIEGQHRLEALRQLGVQDVPVYKIEELADTMPVSNMESAVRAVGPIHPDHAGQLVSHALEHISEGGMENARQMNYGKFQKHYNAALDAIDEPKAVKEMSMAEKIAKARQAADMAPTARIGLEAPGIIVPGKLNNVREAVRGMKGNYGARRVERAADEIPNLERMFQEDALKEVFTGDNARGVMTIDPADFERYASELKGRTKDDIGPKMAELARQGDIDKYTVPMDEYIKYLEQLKDGFSDVPYLNLFKDEIGLPNEAKVIGHEGRHRNRALANQGQPASLVQIQPRGDLREGMPRRTQEDFIEALRQELDANNRLVIPESEPWFRRPSVQLPDVYAKGGEVHMSIGGRMAKIGKAAKTAKAVAEAEKALPAPAVIPNLLKKSTASEIGREERARRQAAGAAEQARQELAKQTPMPIGYVKHTEKSPNPHVGYRYEAVQHPGIQEPIPIDLAKLEREKKGASLGVIPWDSQSRNVEVSSISGEPLTIHLDTHGGQPYALDEKHLEELIGGSSAKEVADAIKERDRYAIKENLEKGGTGEVVHAVTTMGKYGENYAHTPSEFAFELINRRLQEGRLSNKDLDYLNNLIRTQQDKKIQRDKGIFPYANFAGFETPEGLEQIYKGGLGLQTSPGNLRKAIAENLHKVKQQELLGFNSEDFINATSEPSLRGVDKGYIGGTLLSNDIGSAGFYGPRKDRFGMELAPSSGFPYESPYSTDFSARYYGQLPEMIPLDVVMHRQLAPLEQGFLARPNKKPYTEKSLRNAAIGSLEKSNEGVSQIMDDRFFQDLSDYMEALKKPLEKKKGGLAQAKKPKKVARHGNTVSN